MAHGATAERVSCCHGEHEHPASKSDVVMSVMFVGVGVGVLVRFVSRVSHR